MENLIIQAELARRMGVSRKEVTKWKKEGRLVWKGAKIDYELTLKLLDETRTQAKGGASITYKDAQTVKEVARAQLTQMQVKERKGELVNAKDLERELTTLFTTIKTRIRAIAPKVALEIAHLKMAKKKQRQVTSEVQEIIKKEADEALQELSEYNTK